MLMLVACAKNPEQRLQAGQSTLQHSLTIDKDTIIWPVQPEQPGLTIDSPEPVVLDFGGAFVQSAVFGESPQNYTGLAILLRQAPAVTIRNATFAGFQTGILAEAVPKITLENCQFIDFKRGGTDASIAVQLTRPGELQIRNTRFQHLDQALVLEAPTTVDVQQSAFLWLNQQVLNAAPGSQGDFRQNDFFYIGLSTNTSAFTGGDFAFRQNYWAQVSGDDLPLPQLIDTDNYLAYQPSLPATQWAKDTVEHRLRIRGVSAPALRLQDEWGWYDFSYPKVWLREQNPEKDIYLLTGPQGNWRLIGGAGYAKVVPKTGNFPTTLQAFREPGTKPVALDFEYLGKKYRPYGVYPVQTSPVSFGIQSDQ